MELPTELIVNVCSFMTDQTVLTVASVCKSWNDIAYDDQFWRARAAVISSKETRLSTCLLDAEDGKWVKMYKELGDVFIPTRMLNLLQEGIAASSTDNQQELSNTLTKDELFWSSLGSDNPDSNEHVVYKLVQPLCIVKYVDVYAYKALYQSGMPIYAPQYVRVSIGFSPNLQNMHYTSEPFPMMNTDALQRITLPEPQFGGFVRLDLLGRYKTQPGDELFYTVLRHVRVGGVPSGALMDKVYLTNALLRYAFGNEFFVKNFDIGQNPELESQDVFEMTKNKLQHGISASLQIERRKLDETSRIAQLIAEEKFPAAAKLAVLSASELELRNEEILSLFKKAGGLRSYFSVLLTSRANLNACESLALAELSLQKGDFNLFDSFLRSEKIQSSEELGDFFVKHRNLNLAVYVYIRAHIPDKVNDTLLRLGQYAKIINYATITMRRLDFASMLAKFSEMHPKPLTYEFALALAVHPLNTHAFLPHDTIREILKISAPDLIKFLTDQLARFQDPSAEEDDAAPPVDNDNNNNNNNNQQQQ